MYAESCHRICLVLSAVRLLLLDHWLTNVRSPLRAKFCCPILQCNFGCVCGAQSFQTLLQVLSNADLRAKYDAHGVEGLDVNFMDTAEFFSMLFGSESFDHLLGELSLARMTRCGIMTLCEYYFLSVFLSVYTEPTQYLAMSGGWAVCSHTRH